MLCGSSRDARGSRAVTASELSYHSPRNESTMLDDVQTLNIELGPMAVSYTHLRAHETEADL
eukprot:4134847-Amphidinium_carterae.1